MNSHIAPANRKEKALQMYCPNCKKKAYPLYIKDPNYKRLNKFRWCSRCKKLLKDHECWTTTFAKHYTANMSPSVRNRYLKEDPNFDTYERLQSDIDTYEGISGE